MTTMTIRLHPVPTPVQKARSRMNAQALRASGANGFGDAIVAAPVAPATTSAPAQRLLARLAAWWQQRREAAAQRRDLRLLAQLDATTLRDLGIHPGELPSLAAELHGTAAATRRWTDRAHAHSGDARLRINSVDCFL